ncbi:hypothetical protein SAMN05216593_1092 [Pseudomonas asturiensis]|uniref:Uncharacterized protein n=1 Tax=Pseudomonas asturiensis TaxID=1190415 RepID=A0A1M7PA82_9PSED|nr:ABC-three component system middle component 6 [Pseudomonas asturiensis]SHN13377.1 hypothetical protein SAMN05216593_1092 [Pseudomonas asturiensis]
MLMPAKHITFAESLLGFGSYVLATLSEPMTIDQVWRIFERDSNKYPAYQSFDNLILAVDVLFAVGALTLNEYGELELKKVGGGVCA